MNHTKSSRRIHLAAAALLVLGLSTGVSAVRAEIHSGHEHGAPGAKGHAHGGEAVDNDLGSTVVGALKLSIKQEAVVKAGGEAAFDIVIAEGQQAPKAMRAWYGAASAKGSVKTKLISEPDRHYHSHVEVPKAPAAGSKYWLEVEPKTGAKVKAGFDVISK